MNHLTFSVSNLKNSKYFYEHILEGELVYESDRTVYLILGGVWIALNEERTIPRHEIKYSYTHIAFTINESDYQYWYDKLIKYRVTLVLHK
ncbi:VOC family protein [Macrococcus lamae]|uniref:VOC family protein n=1 Tax=Macrococcus lamae TaxID=198484 RepID=UPI001FB7689B|nr:VOC family protein [Macrococcus lamae]